MRHEIPELHLLGIQTYRRAAVAQCSGNPGWRVPDSKPDSIEDPLCTWACCTLNNTWGVKCPPVGVVWTFGEEGCHLRCRPLHLTAVQNDKVVPKTALV
ncbi:hypothetical protein AVEN_126452-1 [Araneus ventricosus]|uniref:Uncharacterized protein n=1 Tax=Araneus ventricosus TaxID=182803 RepID=A0A4Y2DJ44_ARAVE|nr:hypothetical protein AVEN_126452-1 [Araneus ventricosus]